MNAVDILKYGQLTVLHTLEAFPESSVETTGACGVWSVKEIIAHLASFEQMLVDVLSSFLGNAETPYLDRMIELGGQGFNDIEVDRRKAKTIQEVCDELAEAHTRALALAQKIPQETYRQPGTLPWYGLEYALDDYLVYTFYGHKREHSAQIAAFNDVISRGGAQ